ncbi:MAG: amidophosphoribosyltransferase [Candidatus Odinarchaeia archaeon]
MEKLKEHCGVVGIYSEDPNYQVSHLIFDALLILQHRGQESAGMSVFDGHKIRTHRGMGPVNEAFSNNILANLFGHVGIGHTRYSTAGRSTLENAQPLTIDLGNVGFSLAFNGTITNYQQLRDNLIRKGHMFTSDTDTEVIAHILATNMIQNENDTVKALDKTMGVLEGAYSMVLVDNQGNLLIARDPLGFRPLCIGKIDEFIHIVASESVVFDILGGKFIRDVKPGEIVLINKDGIKSYEAYSAASTYHKTAHCMFEYVYFARPDSIIEGITVHDVRVRLGRILAKLHPVDADIVIPVPDSGRCAAVGYSQESGIPIVEGLIKNRSIWRTFIMPYPELRERLVRIKLNPVKSAIENKRIILVDDSIVRSTTSRRIVKILRNAGAKEVHMRISCPPLISPCYMGIDFPRKEELIAANKSIPEVCKEIGADSLGYMTIDGLVEAIGLPKNRLCLACLTGKYPNMKAISKKQAKLV